MVGVSDVDTPDADEFIFCRGGDFFGSVSLFDGDFLLSFFDGILNSQ
jgi:hypothetical protein